MKKLNKSLAAIILAFSFNTVNAQMRMNSVDSLTNSRVIKKIIYSDTLINDTLINNRILVDDFTKVKVSKVRYFNLSGVEIVNTNNLKAFVEIYYDDKNNILGKQKINKF